MENLNAVWCHAAGGEDACGAGGMGADVVLLPVVGIVDHAPDVVGTVLTTTGRALLTVSLA